MVLIGEVDVNRNIVRFLLRVAPVGEVHKQVSVVTVEVDFEGEIVWKSDLSGWVTQSDVLVLQ